jgi:hypothetical protein
MALEALDTQLFADANLWELGFEKNWEKLKKILAPVTGNNFAVTEQKHRLLIDDIRRKFDASTTSSGRTIMEVVFVTNAANKRRMADVAELILSVGMNPDAPDDNGWRPAHIVGQAALVELVPTIFACRPDMTALNANKHTPFMAASCTNYVSQMQNPRPNSRAIRIIHNIRFPLALPLATYTEHARAMKLITSAFNEVDMNRVA